MNRYRMFFVQTSTRPPNMHLKLTKHGKFYKQNNQLPTKSHDEFKDNSNPSPKIIYEYMQPESYTWVLIMSRHQYIFQQYGGNFQAIYNIYVL